MLPNQITRFYFRHSCTMKTKQTLQYKPYGGCPGSADNNCWPNGVWSGNIASGTNYHIFWLNSGSFNSNTNPYTLAGGVRCVPDLKFLEAKEVFRDEDRQKDCLTFI